MQIEISKPADTFSKDIETLVTKSDLSYMEAILHWCEIKNVDSEYVATLVNSDIILKTKLQAEASSLNFLPRSTRQAI